MSDNDIYSLRLEKHVLGGLIKYPEIFYEIQDKIGERDFFGQPNHTIFFCLKEILNKGENLDIGVLANRIRNLNIASSGGGEEDIYNRLHSLKLIPINKKGVVEAADELTTYRVRREVDEKAEEIKTYVKNPGNDNKEKIITTVDKIFNEKISIGGEFKRPEKVFEKIAEKIEERAENPLKEMGMATPHPDFNRLFGGVLPGHLYAWVSRPKHGKSTILADLARKMSAIHKCPALILDTEMAIEDLRYKMAAAITGIPLWHLITGNWKHNKEYFDLYEQKKGLLNEAKDLVSHLEVPGKPIEQICSIVRRWYLSEVGRGNKCIVVYDYIKLTGESGWNKQEYQLIGEKVDALKQLSTELNIPILTSCQLNRQAESGTDDGSAIAQSDRLTWLVSFVGIFRRKRTEEIEAEGEQFGTHKLIPVASRLQGRDAAGHQDLVRIPTGNPNRPYRYETNFINYDVSNFNVTERGTLADVQEARNLNVNFDRPVEEERAIVDEELLG